MKERKLTIGIALVLIVFSLFVSCSGEIDEPGIGNEDAYARFVYGNSRSIGVSYDIADFNELYWFYTATKIDEFGTKGETTNPVPVAGTADIPEQGLNAKLGPFSQGKWKFTLTAYNDAEQKSKVYEGSVETSLSAGDNIVSLTVEPQGTTGTVKFINAFFSWNKENDTATGVPTFEFKLTKEDGTEYISILAQDQLIKVNEKYSITGNLEIPSTSGATSADIPTGDYSCSISVYYTVDEEKYEIYAQNFNFQVFASTETVLYGEITEEVFSSVTFDPSKSDLVIFDENTSVVTVPVVPNSDADEQTTTIDFGSNVFSSEGELALTVKAMSENEASEGFTAIDSSTQAAVAAIDFTLTNNGTEVNTFVNGNVEIVTYIAKGLNKESLQLVYVTDGQIADSQNGHEITDYEPATGKLVFTTNHFSTFYVTTKMDGGEKGFAGGAGTQAHPYLIENVEQFMNIASLQDDMLTSDGKGAYLYFSITEDLDFSDTENLGIQLVRGELDFNNHWVTGVHSDNLASGHYSLIFDVIEGKIKNLNYEPDTAVQFVYTSGYLDAVSVMDERVISFENVNVSGTFENVANNGSLYISQAFDGSLEFHNCVNSSVMTGNQYNGVFLGGYPNSRTERLVFDNCRFTGSLIVKNAGFLVGNSAGFASEVVVKDCVNDGLVAGTEDVGYYCGLNPDMPEVKVLNEDVQKYISGSGHVRVLDSGLSASYNNDKTVVTISCKDSGSVSYKVAATGYSKMRTPDYKDYGTLLVSFEAEGEFGEPGETVNISFPVQKVVDYIYAERNGGVESQDSFGNDIVTIGGTTYYLVVEKHPLAEDYSVTSMIIDNQNEHIAADLDYSVYSYDADGVPTGYRKLEV